MHISPEAKQRIAALIEQRQLKLAPIAKRIGTSYSTLWNFIHGNTENFGKLQPLADALGVTLDWIQHGGPRHDPQQRFADNNAPRYQAAEPGPPNQFSDTIPLAVGIELAIRAALGEGRKPAAETLAFVRESMFRIAAGAKKPLTEREFIDYAKGFLAMKK